MPMHLRERLRDEPQPLPHYRPRCEPSHVEIMDYLEEISDRLAKIEEGMERN